MRKQVWMKVRISALLSVLLACGIACGDGQDKLHATIEKELVQKYNVSECGGFSIYKTSRAPDYCGAEVLYWEYATQSGALKLTNTRVLLNCCGQHSMQLELLDGVYIATEFDQPDEEMTRCRCMCVFDFEVEAQGIAQSSIFLRLDRVITDRDDVSGTAWEGQLDLSEESGFVVIDDTPVSSCQRND